MPIIYILNIGIKIREILETVDWENSDDSNFTCQQFLRNCHLALNTEDGRIEKTVISNQKTVMSNQLLKKSGIKST